MKKIWIIAISFIATACSHNPAQQTPRQPNSTQNMNGIISDVDDTIRISYTGGGFQNKVLVFLTKETFIGQSDLYNGVLQQTEQSAPTMAFVSAAPGKETPGNSLEKKFYGILSNTVHGLIKKFEYPAQYTLDMAPEPYGKILDRKEKLKKVISYKVKAAESRMIDGITYSLYGDDTEADHLAYAQMVKNAPQKISNVFIHKVKGIESIPVGLLYYTAFEPALVEYSEGRLSRADLLKIGQKLLDPNIDFEKVIPYFAVCPNPTKEKNWMTTLAENKKINDAEIIHTAALLEANIHYYCSIRNEARQLNAGQ